MRATALALVLSLLASIASAQDGDTDPGDTYGDVTPVETEPAQAEPAQAEPAQPGPAQRGPGRAEPTIAPPPARTARPAPRYEPAPAPPPPRRARDEEEEPEEDGGDPYDFLWIELFGGVSYVDLRAFSQENFYPEFVRLEGTGGMGGAAIGFRIEFVSIGVRASVAHYGDEFDVGTAMGEIMLSIPLPVVKPYLRVGFGLGWHGDSDFNAPERSQTTVFGFAFNGSVGLDVYLADWFAIGAAASLDILNMNRQSFEDPVPGVDEVRFEETGDAVGYQLRGQLAVSFHF